MNLLLAHLLWAALSPELVEEATLRLFYLQLPLGYERYSLSRDADDLLLSSDFDFTDRGGRVQLQASLRMAAVDLTPRRFEARGKSYRFVNVDSEVRLEKGFASVRVRNQTSRVSVPERVFTVDGYAPFSVQMMLVRYWNARGRPEVLATIPGEPLNEVRVEHRGRDEVRAGGRVVALDRYTLEGVVWGRETLWLSESGAFAAAVTRAGGLTFEGVREDLADALPTFAALAAEEAVSDLGRISRDIEPRASGSYALVGAALVDGTGSAAVKDSTVLVRNGRIEAVGPRAEISIPAGVASIDLRGKTIAPGLWDMHTHVTQMEWGPVYLAAGVTTVRDMGNERELLLALRDALDSGSAIGPRLLLAGLVDGGGSNAFGTVAAANAEEGRAVVRRYHDEGFHQVKLYNQLAPDVVAAIAGEAHRLGMTVTGHVPASMTLQQAVEAGMDHIAHLAIRDEPASLELRRTTELLRENGTVLDPTLSWGELLGRSTSTPIASFQPGFPRIPAPLRRLFDSAGNADVDPAAARDRLERSLRIVGELHRGGVPIVAGTDEGIPGHSLHRELELYVEAGLTPLEAIQSATIVPARAMGLEKDLGTIEPGKGADLVVLDANPLERISNVRSVRYVVTGGRMYEAAELWRSVRFLP
jgi:imidazolonepropionase-like amidohydrolase